MASSCALTAGVSATRVVRASPSASAVASRRRVVARPTNRTSCLCHAPPPTRARVVALAGDPIMLWDDTQRKFVDGGCTTTSLDDPCVQGLAITPAEVIERITKAKGAGGRLDLTGIGLREVPSEVWTLTDLADLQLSNNKLISLPDQIGNLVNLERLGLAGNRLRKLPDGLGGCTSLQGLWAHGNLLKSLPNSIENCEYLRLLMLAGNKLKFLPDGIGKLVDLEELSVPGNCLEALPESIVECGSLRTLDVHGNFITALPSSMGKRCRSLEDMSLQGNRLVTLPDSLCDARRLKRLNVAENALETLPENIGDAAMLNQLWVYANPSLASLPVSLARNVSLKAAWAEGCSFHGDGGNALRMYISHAAEGGGGKRKTPPAILGVDFEQLASAGMDGNKVAEFVKVSETASVASRGAGGDEAHQRGYFKLEKWVVSKAMTEEQGGSDATTRAAATRPTRAPVLIVAFGSAPGVPNWGGLLKKLKIDVDARGKNNLGGAGAFAAAAVHAAKQGFDVLYVADTARSWYGGDGFGNGEQEEMAWRAALGQVANKYEKVIHLGDSMGASAALLFADLSDISLAFCPQVCLVEASIRPGRSAVWMKRYETSLIAAVKRCVETNNGHVVIHTGSWQHDVDQASAVLARLGSDSETSYTSAKGKGGGKVTLITHHVDNHRVALALEEGGELLPIVRTALHDALAGIRSGEGKEKGEDDSYSSAVGVDDASAKGVDSIALRKFNPATAVKK